MIYLLFSILSSTLIVLVLKAFTRFEIDTFQAIVYNYVVAVAIGIPLIDGGIDVSATLHAPWLIYAFALGCFFVIMFFVMGLSAQRVGVTATALANNVSMVLPIIAAVILYGDPMPAMKIFGIVLALVGVFLAIRQGKGQGVDAKYLYLPILLFFGSGIIGIVINYCQATFLSDAESLTFIPTLFLIAAVIGFVILVITVLLGKRKFGFKHLLAGIALGIPNYCSIYFLMKSLDLESLTASEVFPINNMGVMMVSAIAGWLIFRERLNKTNWIGIVLSLLGIVLIAFYPQILSLLEG
jgi:drug/metabolite transporter (DMT)-like permease